MVSIVRYLFIPLCTVWLWQCWCSQNSYHRMHFYGHLLYINIPISYNSKKIRENYIVPSCKIWFLLYCFTSKSQLLNMKMEISYMEFQPNHSRNFESMCRNSCTPLISVWLSLSWFSWNLCLLNSFCREIFTGFHENLTSGSAADVRSQTEIYIVREGLQLRFFFF